MKPNRDFSFTVKVPHVKFSAISISILMWMLQRRTTVIKNTTIEIMDQQGFTSSINKGKHNTLPWCQRWQVDYDIVLVNFKMKLKPGCCSKIIRIRFDLDKLNEPEIELGVPYSDWWIVRSPQSDLP